MTRNPSRPTWETVRALRRKRPKDRFLRMSYWAMGLLLIGAWFTPDLQLGQIDWERRLQNGGRFLEKITPWPLTRLPADASAGENWMALGAWTQDLMAREGWEAVGNTLALSVAAIVLAGMLAVGHLPLASRTLAVPEPYSSASQRRRPTWPLWLAACQLGRGSLLLWRSIPEYILAFFFISAFGLNAWPGVLALALHNSGTLGRLSSELVENMPSRLPETLRALGASRLQILGFAAAPALLPRFLVYFFYRWETCIRDATVLGILGIASLGYSLMEARAHDRLDEMMFFVGLGGALVMLGDIVSYVVRRWARRAHSV